MHGLLCKSSVDDEGRPFGIGFQEQISNHQKQLLSKAAVVSVLEKSRITRQVGIRETNNHESLLSASLDIN